MTESLHLAAQYLAAAGISFLKKEEDDSHTNLGFDPASGRLSSRPLNDEGDQLFLDYSDFSLAWGKSDKTEKLLLHEQRHTDILKWISDRARITGLNKPYKYELHYELPYTINEEYRFKLTDTDKLAELRSIRTIAQQAIEAISWDYSLDSEVRIWPHHFDTGIFGILPERPALSIGLGLAIPDSVIHRYYFYAAAYEGHSPMKTTDFEPLSEGKWLNVGFTGAVLEVEKPDRERTLNFFSEAIQVFSLA